MISKKNITMCLITVALIVYLFFALGITRTAASEAPVAGTRISIIDSLDTKFVTEEDILAECGLDTMDLSHTSRGSLDIYRLEQRLRSSDKIQNVNVALLSSGVIDIRVKPMVPVARVFDNGQSYYINAEGKKISADLRYCIDVPVLTGSFDSIRPASRLLPMLDYIASDERLSSLVSTIVQEPDGNIIVVPVIVGHVVNFGDTADVADKFNRLRTFYRQVAPKMGWTTYDEISVKWRGQVVANRRTGKWKSVALPTTVMEADTVASDAIENAPMDEMLEGVADEDIDAFNLANSKTDHKPNT